MLSRTGRKSPIYTLYSTNDLSATIVTHVKENFNARILAKTISRVAPAVVLIREGVRAHWGLKAGVRLHKALGITIARHYGNQMYVCTASMRF